MKKRQIIAPLSLAAVGGAVGLVLMKKGARQGRG